MLSQLRCVDTVEETLLSLGRSMIDTSRTYFEGKAHARLEAVSKDFQIIAKKRVQLPVKIVFGEATSIMYDFLLVPPFQGYCSF